jgi:diguanylate cyclase (GGDEF)-like protein
MTIRGIRLGLGGRFTLLLALIGVLASGLTGYYAFSTSRDLLVGAAEQRLLTATKVLVRQLVVTLESSVRDVRLLAAHPVPLQALQASTPDERRHLEGDVDALFASLLETRPEYFQIRLIKAAEHGLEIVRIDRDSAGLVRVLADELQEKGHYPYVFETLRLPPDKIFISPPAINHEIGAHAGQDKPSVQLAMPIHDGRQVLGIVVINVDLERIFRQLSADLPSNINFMLTNRLGDFLVHPDADKAFAFDRGIRIRVQDEFPATTQLFDGQAEQLVTVSETAGGQKQVVAFVKYRVPVEHMERTFILGLAQPLADVLADSDTVGQATARIVGAFSALAVILAIFLAWTVIRPLSQMLVSVERFTPGQPRMPLPIERSDELGILARGIDTLQNQVDQQVAELREKQQELDHQASHDSLTGLPNRRLFLDRLEHALARSRRNGLPLTLLFIDLDHFKSINDRLGHGAGDLALRTAAERMQSVIREADTLARLGGDEFIILLDATEDHAVITQVAGKLLAVLAEPMSLGDELLPLGGSVGISRYPRDGETAIEIVAAADQAMYRAKNDGRNAYCFASEGD